MEHYAGIDVSLESSSVCVVDATGKIVREGKVASEPEALIAWFGSLGFETERIGLEAGPLSQWLYAAMREAGLAVELLETRHVRDAFKAMPVKTDRKDARGIAQLMRLGWFRPVHCKSMAAQEVRALLTARKLVQSKLRCRDEPARDFARLRAQGRARPRRGALRPGSGSWWPAMRSWRSSPRRCLRCMRCCCGSSRPSRSGFDRWRAGRRRARLLMSTPGVGPIVALTYVSRDRRSRAVQIIEAGGRAFRADAEEVSVRRDRRDRPDQQDRRCPVRTALYEAAHII